MFEVFAVVEPRLSFLACTIVFFRIITVRVHKSVRIYRSLSNGKHMSFFSFVFVTKVDVPVLKLDSFQFLAQFSSFVQNLNIIIDAKFRNCNCIIYYFDYVK